MPTCLCCSSPLLRHLRGAKLYWFCLHCHQEMPNLEAMLQSESSRCRSSPPRHSAR